MIRVRIEMLPFGNDPAEEIATFDIVNLADHKDAPHFANYEARGHHNSYGEVNQLWCKVRNFRREQGIFALLRQICLAWSNE